MIGKVAIWPTSKLSVGESMLATRIITELLHAPCRYLSESASLNTLVPATSKTCPAGLKRNAIDPLEIFDQVIEDLK